VVRTQLEDGVVVVKIRVGSKFDRNPHDAARRLDSGKPPADGTAFRYVTVPMHKRPPNGSRVFVAAEAPWHVERYPLSQRVAREILVGEFEILVGASGRDG